MCGQVTGNGWVGSGYNIIGQVVVREAGEKPLIAHLIHRLDFGGLENGLVNLINHMPFDRYRHAVICLTDYSEFAQRINRSDVEVYALHKSPGKDLGVYKRLWKLLRQLKPTILHSRNLAALDSQVIAWLAGVPCRVHSEHGWDMVDLHGENTKYKILRKIVQPFVHRFLALSKHQLRWMRRQLSIPNNRLLHIYNGVDIERFNKRETESPQLDIDWSPVSDPFVVGTVGRMQTVKDQLTLAKAFVELCSNRPEVRERLRLIMVGDGPLREQVNTLLTEAGVRDLAWLPGSRNDIAAILAQMDLFVLPSLNEGISNTILEAMASGLPVLATDVGGNPELVLRGMTGQLVPPQQPKRMAESIAWYLDQPHAAKAQGCAARARIEQEFSLQTMVTRYLDFYDSSLADAGAHN